MRMSELSRESGVPTATIKYYLREGLLPRGHPTAATQAEYSDAHVRRLRLIRSLVDIAGLPLTDVRAVCAAVDNRAPIHQALGRVQHAVMRRHAGDAELEPEATVVTDLVGRRGWLVYPDTPARRAASRAVGALESAGWPVTDEDLSTLADGLERIAARELAQLATALGEDGDKQNLIERAAATMTLGERLLVAIYRLAQEDASARAFGVH